MTSGICRWRQVEQWQPLNAALHAADCQGKDQPFQSRLLACGNYGRVINDQAVKPHSDFPLLHGIMSLHHPSFRGGVCKYTNVLWFKYLPHFLNTAGEKNTCSVHPQGTATTVLWHLRAHKFSVGLNGFVRHVTVLIHSLTTRCFNPL